MGSERLAGSRPYPSNVAVLTSIINAHEPTERVAVSHEDFHKKLRGHSFEHWSDFKKALGKAAHLAPEVGGEVRLTSGLSIAFVIILNVLIWAVVAFILAMMKEKGPRLRGWTVFFILCIYGASVGAYCNHAYADPDLRIITNFLFGAVPLAVSAASYLLALLVLDLIRSTMHDGWETSFSSRLRPWEESFDGRLIFFLAVLPGLALSAHLGNSVSTGFQAAATHFDVLSLCLFIDVARYAGHCSYLFYPEWSIGKSPSSISSRPGLCYVFFGVCLWWYVVLARLEAGRASALLADGTKIHTLACLTSFAFFPLAIYLGIMNVREFFEQLEVHRALTQKLMYILVVFMVAVFMLVTAVVFDAIEPNLMGIAGLLFVVFFGAFTLSYDLLSFILAMLPLAALAYGAAVCSNRYAPMIRSFVFFLLGR